MDYQKEYRKRHTVISISEENYEALKDLGRAGDSFNDVITKLVRAERR